MDRIIELYYEMLHRRLNPTLNIHKQCLKAAIRTKDFNICQLVLQQIRQDVKIRYDLKCWQLVLTFIEDQDRYSQSSNTNNDKNYRNDNTDDFNNKKIINKEYREYENIIKNEMILNSKNGKFY